MFLQTNKKFIQNFLNRINIKLYFLFFDKANHSSEVSKKHIVKKKVNKNEPFIIKKKLKGIKINELNILFSNSLVIKYFHNFFLFF